MKLKDVKEKIKKHLYLEDTGVLDVSLATVIANTLQLEDRIWLAIVGESSGGKSQIIRPITKSNPNYFIKIDDLTENTFLTGARGAVSLLNEDTVNNMLSISDLTVLFSRNAESRNAILGQFRNVFDGSMTKRTGNGDNLEWNGYMGMIAGCTPSIYRYFAEVADMGERFIYYRLRPNNPEKATRLALTRSFNSRQLDDEMSATYQEYTKNVVQFAYRKKVELPPNIVDRIIEVAMFAEKIRTPIHKDRYSGKITDIPIPALPMRTSLQLKAVAKGMMAMNMYEGEQVVDIGKAIDWVAFSMANENKRKIMEVMSRLNWSVQETISAQQVGQYLGLETSVASSMLQELSAVGVTERDGQKFKIKDYETFKIVSRICGDMDIEIPEEVIEEEEVAF